MNISKVGVLLGLLICCAFAQQTVLADSVSFSNVSVVQSDGTRLDLATNQGTTLFGTDFDFLVDIQGATPAAGVHTLRVIFEEAGFDPVIQTFRVPLFDGLPPDYSQLFSFQAQSSSTTGTPVVLTVSLIEDLSAAIIQNQTYKFNVAEPVPEPATLFLLGGGMIGFVASCRSRLRAKQAPD